MYLHIFYTSMAGFSQMGNALSANNTYISSPGAVGDDPEVADGPRLRWSGLATYTCSSTSDESSEDCETPQLMEDQDNDENHASDKPAMSNRNERKTKKKTENTQREPQVKSSGQKRKGDDDYERRGTKKVDMSLETKSWEPGPCGDTHYQKSWDDYCNLPVFPDGGRQKSKLIWYRVSLDNNMVYCGPFRNYKRQLLSFKAHVLCDIAKDPHSAELCVSGDVLMFPICNPGMLAKCDSGDVYEVFQPIRLASQSKRVLGKQPVSLLEHCLLRYILDIGDTLLSHMVLQAKTQTFINWHIYKPWGNTSLTCKDRIVQFFDNRMRSQNSLLFIRCMVLQHKASLLKFLKELDMLGIELAAERYKIRQSFVDDMKTRVNLIHSVLSNFDINNLLEF